jgi:hypothetical protein
MADFLWLGGVVLKLDSFSIAVVRIIITARAFCELLSRFCVVLFVVFGIWV